MIGLNIEFEVQKLLESVRQEAANNNFSKVTTVHIRLGPWENIDTQHLIKAFDRMKGKGLLDDASLIVDKDKMLARCRYCGSLFEVIFWKNRCKYCGSNYMEFIGDRGIILETIEGEE